MKQPMNISQKRDRREKLNYNILSNKHIFSLAKIKFQAKEKIMDIKDKVDWIYIIGIFEDMKNRIIKYLKIV